MHESATIDGVSAEGWSAPLLTALGTAVVAVGDDVDGAPAVAVWQVSPEGAPTGAWVVLQHDAYRGRGVARRLLSCIDGRAVTGPELGAVDDAVGRLSDAAGLELTSGWWRARRVSPVDVFGEVVGRRAEYEKTIEVKRESNKNIVPLEWRRDFPADDLPTDLEALRALSSLGLPAGPPAVAQALIVSRVLQWLVELWSETEQMKNRRRYLRDEHGEPDTLPPSWLVPMKTAQASRLSL